jgi:hypothetical protein
MNRLNWLREVSECEDVIGVLLFCPGAVTVLTTTMTTFGLPDTLSCATVELAARLLTPSVRADGSEGWGIESLRARVENIPAIQCDEVRETRGRRR